MKLLKHFAQLEANRLSRTPEQQAEERMKAAIGDLAMMGRLGDDGSEDLDLDACCARVGAVHGIDAGTLLTRYLAWQDECAREVREARERGIDLVARFLDRD